MNDDTNALLSAMNQMLIEPFRKGMINEGNKIESVASFKNWSTTLYGEEMVKKFLHPFESIFSTPVTSAIASEKYDVDKNGQMLLPIQNKMVNAVRPGWTWDWLGLGFGTPVIWKVRGRTIATSFVGQSGRDVYLSDENKTQMTATQFARKYFPNEGLDFAHVAQYMYVNGTSVPTLCVRKKRMESSVNGTYVPTTRHKCTLFDYGAKPGDYVIDRINNCKLIVTKNECLMFNEVEYTYEEYVQKFVSKNPVWKNYQLSEMKRKMIKTPPPVSDNFVLFGCTFTEHAKHVHALEKRNARR